MVASTYRQLTPAELRERYFTSDDDGRRPGRPSRPARLGSRARSRRPSRYDGPRNADGDELISNVFRYPVGYPGSVPPKAARDVSRRIAALGVPVFDWRSKPWGSGNIVPRAGLAKPTGGLWGRRR